MSLEIWNTPPSTRRRDIHGLPAHPRGSAVEELSVVEHLAEEQSICLVGTFDRMVSNIRMNFAKTRIKNHDFMSLQELGRWMATCSLKPCNRESLPRLLP